MKLNKICEQITNRIMIQRTIDSIGFDNVTSAFEDMIPEISKAFESFAEACEDLMTIISKEIK